MNSSEKHECSWDGPSMAPYSMTEPYECHEDVAVHHLGAEVGFCTHHFAKFDKEFGWQFPWAPESQLSGNCIEGLIQIVADVEQRIGCCDLPGGDTSSPTLRRAQESGQIGAAL